MPNHVRNSISVEAEYTDILKKISKTGLLEYIKPMPKSLDVSDVSDSCIKKAKEWKDNGALLNITIDEMKTKVTSLSAALKKSGEASDLSALNVHRLQRTKDQWKELFKVQTANIKDQRDRELTAINDTFNFRNLK